MTFFNLLGLIFLALALIGGLVSRIVLRRRLREIDGFGGKYRRGRGKGRLIGKF